MSLMCLIVQTLCVATEFSQKLIQKTALVTCLGDHSLVQGGNIQDLLVEGDALVIVP